VLTAVNVSISFVIEQINERTNEPLPPLKRAEKVCLCVCLSVCLSVRRAATAGASRLAHRLGRLSMYCWRQMRQGQFGRILLKFNKFQYTKIHIIIAVKWVFPSQNTPKSMSAGASSQTPLGKLTALPRLPSWFQWAASRQEGNGGIRRCNVYEVRKIRSFFAASKYSADHGPIRFRISPLIMCVMYYVNTLYNK